MDVMEALRDKVSKADASLKDILHDDRSVALDAIFDLVEVLTAAKAVVLEA